MKSVNSKNRRSTTRLRLLFVAPLCLLALVCGMLAGSTSRAAQGRKTQAAEASGKGAVRTRGARPDGRAKPAVNKSRGASPLADPIGCGTNPAAITIGGAVNGTLAAGDCEHPSDGSLYDAYSFSGTAGQFVIITMTSSNVDPFLYVLRPNEVALDYRTIQFDDIDPDDLTDPTDSVNLNSRVIMVLPQTGTYTILANSALRNQTGAYTLQIGGGCAATPNIASGTVNGSLQAGDCQFHDGTLVDIYSFNATAGQEVSVEMERTGSSTVDPFLFLLSNDGFTELARNDDGLTGGAGGNFGARIPSPTRFTQGSGRAVVPASGTYYIIANTLETNESGTYALRLALGSNCPVQAITAGQTLNGSIAISDCRLPFDGSFLDVYTFEGTAGQQFTATMASSAFDTYLLLYDQQGFLVYEDDDGGGGLNARIPHPEDGNTLTLPVTGTYRIYANAAAPSITAGAYTLSVSTANCAVTLTAASRSVPAGGGQFTDNFTLPAGCAAPSISTADTFVTGLSVSLNGTQGTFSYTVAANTGAARNGTINVGGQTFTVAQAGAGACAVGISPTVVPFAQAGGAGRFTVVPNNQGDTQCAWTAATTANFITINTGATGTGTNRVTYTVLPNNSGAARTGTITVNGVTHTVTQLSGAPPTVAFSAATFDVSEGAASRSVTITVSRTDVIAVASTVEYRTVAETDAQAQVPCRPTQPGAGGTASPRCDFATTIDTLVFEPNDFQKTFTIPLINDVHFEGLETFQIELVNPQGATLGAQSTATVRIADNDTAVPAAGTNPVRPPLPYNADSPRFFVRMQYLDFLSREPEAGEPWTGVLLRPDCNPESLPSVQTDCDRIGVSKAFFESDENRRKGRFVFLYHKASFGSAQNPNFFPEYRDFVIDLARVTGRTPAETIDKQNNFSEEWVTRAAFTARYAGKNNAQFVDEVLANVNTTLTQAGSGFTRDSLVNDLNNGASRADVLRRIVESPEVSNQQFNHAYVATQYYGYLRRTPELSGYLSWLNAINQTGNNLRVMVNGFMNSQEYLLRFGPEN